MGELPQLLPHPLALRVPLTAPTPGEPAMPSSVTLEAKSSNRVAGDGALEPFASAPALAFRPVAAPAVRSLEVVAPLSGVIVPLDAVPDPVFANRMVGDGVSIDPTSCEVLAPFAGEVTQLHDS